MQIFAIDMDRKETDETWPVRIDGSRGLRAAGAEALISGLRRLLKRGITLSIVAESAACWMLTTYHRNSRS